MTTRLNTGVIATLFALLFLVAPSGCASTSIEDAVPAAAATAPAAFAQPGTYPNLNVIPKPAAEQISAGEKASDTAALRAKLKQQNAEGAARRVDNRAAELRKLARSHGSATLEEIEGE